MGVLTHRYYNTEDVAISEQDKSDFSYLSQSVDFYIAALVREKTHIKHARNLYDGIRDKDEFKYLEDVFGIESALSVKMTPLIKTRIDILVGILLDETFTFRTTIKDTETLTRVENLKAEEFSKRIIEKYTQLFNDNIKLVNKGEKPSQFANEDKFIVDLKARLDKDFVSQFQSTVVSLLRFFEQDKTIDLKQKLKQIFVDLLVAGEAYYRTYVYRVGEDPKLEVCKPENMFFSKNTNFQFMSTGSQPNVNACVHRKFVKRSEILTEWGHLMTDEQKRVLFGQSDAGAAPRIRDPRQLDHIYSTNTVLNQHTNSTWDTMPVYHVEWLANNEIYLDEEDKDRYQNVEDISHTRYPDPIFGDASGSGRPNTKAYRLDRYEGIRIGWNIYLNLGKSKHQPRSIGAPYLTTLSYNGVTYNDRNAKPYSLSLALKDLQDSFDIVTFFRDNLIANAGVDGSRVNLAAIPKVLGQDYMERLLKFIALRKQGIEVYDPTEEGANLFSGYGDFHGSLNGNTIEQLNIVLESIQAQADIVTGINRYMYQAAEQRDAVSNVKTGIKQTSLITKDIFELIYDTRCNALYDLVNCGKIAYQDGKRGSYILGDKTMFFHAQPENFRFTDFDIHLVNSSRENLKLEKLAALAPQLAGKGSIDDEVLVKALLSESTTDVVAMLDESLAKRKAENDQVKQLSEQLQQLQTQLDQAGKELEKAQAEKEKLEKVDREYKTKDLAIREEDTKARIRQGDDRIDLERTKTEAEAQKDAEVVRLEREQLYADNVSGNARQVKNDL